MVKHPKDIKPFLAIEASSSEILNMSPYPAYNHANPSLRQQAMNEENNIGLYFNVAFCTNTDVRDELVHIYNLYIQ